MAVAETRRRILEAALACFLEDGYERTTIARIREMASVSNGALFHHFSSKERIAEALYVDAIASFQEGVWELIRRRPRSLRTAVRGAIAHQLGWIEAHPDLARFVYMRGHLDWESPGASEVESLNRDLANAITDWMAPLIERGEVRVSSMLLISAVVAGPAHAVARRWLAGQLDRAPTDYVDELADAAWAGLRGRPLSNQATRRKRAERGRVRLELVSEDRVVARGEATTELIPVTTQKGGRT